MKTYYRVEVQGDSKLLSGVSKAYKFQTGNKIKLLREYESVTKKVLLLLELILQNIK
jgi:hypothetical protein